MTNISEPGGLVLTSNSLTATQLKPGKRSRGTTKGSLGDIVRDKKNTKVKPPIFLALQGGGAKGIVHIGGVTALNDLEFEIRGISGTSAGSIVAALLAVGYSPQELFDLDGSGNLFEKLPSKLVKKPTDLFPFWGWITLRTARGLGRGCQAAFSPFSRLMSAISERWVTLFKDTPAPNGSMLRRLWHKSQTTTKKLVRKGWAWTKPLVFGLGFSYLVFVFAQYVTPKLKLLPDAQLTMLVASVILSGAVAVAVVRWIISGITNVSRVRAFISTALTEKLDPADPTVGVTFRDLKKAQKPPLKIVATNVHDQKLELFCFERTPDVAVADAVAASICLPVIFKPWAMTFYRHVNGKKNPHPEVTKFQDGGLVSNLPAWPFDEERRKQSDVATVALAIGEPANSSPKHWLAAITGTVVNGNVEVHTRAAGQISHITLQTSLGMLEFDAPVPRLKAEATGARILSQAQLIDELFLHAHVARRFVGVVQQAVEELLHQSMPDWALIDPPGARLRVGLALQALHDPSTFTIAANAGYEKTDAGLSKGQSFARHRAITAWQEKEAQCFDLSGHSIFSLKDEHLWAESKCLICIPMEMSERAKEHHKNTSPRGCVLIIETNAPIDSRSAHTQAYFESFVASVKTAVLQLESVATKSELRLADFVQRGV
ncbi:hypothetical protein PPUN110474_27440 [Pseudomonas putida]|nr:hypothetical protein PPUN110474_27440 [Pseudomonas putida]